MKRCHCALEQTKHFGENGELRLENSSLVLNLHFPARVIYTDVSHLLLVD